VHPGRVARVRRIASHSAAGQSRILFYLLDKGLRRSFAVYFRHSQWASRCWGARRHAGRLCAGRAYIVVARAARL